MSCKHTKPVLVLLLAVTALISLSSCQFLVPATANQPIICFTFDDGDESIFQTALPIMNQYGYRATCFVNSNTLGLNGKLSTANVIEMHNNWAWEIGGHTLNHEDLPDLSFQAAEVAIGEDYHNLANLGLHPNSFALPRGACPAEFYPIITSYYQNIRGSSDFSMFTPLNRLGLGYLPYQGAWSAAVVQARINRGIAAGECLIVIGFHRLGHTDELDNSYCSADTFRAILGYVQQLGLQVLPLAEAVELLK